MRAHPLHAALAALLLATTALGACDDDGGDDDDTAADTAADTPMDTELPDDGDVVPQAEMTFILTNGGSDPVYAQQSLSAWSWVNVFDAAGNRLQTSWDCGPCVCGEDTCAVCDFAPPFAQALAPGQQVESFWDGRIWSLDTANDCSLVEPAPPGTYTATFCWGSTSTGDDFQTLVADLECASHTFELGTNTTLQHFVVETTTVLPGAALVLENTSAATVFYQANGPDCTAEPAWFSLADAGGTLLELTPDCGLCACARGPECIGGCPELCVPPRVPALDPGASVQHDWSGLVAVTKMPLPGWTCADLEPAPPGPLTARMCWGSARTGDELGGTLEDTTCQTTPLTLGQDTEARIQIP